MSRAVQGILWTLAFVLIESVQFVFFGGLFQRVDSFAFGALVFGVTTAVGLIAVWRWRRAELRLAFAQPRLLLGINVTANCAWAAFLGSVQILEPAVAYTIGAGVMPLATWAFWRLGVPEGQPMRNRIELGGLILTVAAICYLIAVTLSGQSGFVRGGTNWAALGLTLAVLDGVFFVWLLMLCQRLDRRGVGPMVVFTLRFMMYVLVAGGIAVTPVAAENTLSLTGWIGMIAIGILLIVPPLYALQRAVATAPVLTISALTALGPLVIFGLQMVEGRVSYSTPVLAGLMFYFVGALIAGLGAVASERAQS